MSWRRRLSTKFFGFYKAFCYSAVNDNLWRADLDSALRQAVTWLQEEHGVSMIGASRARVKARLEQMLEEDSAAPHGWRSIKQENFARICDEEKLVSEPKFLLDYLHNAGAVFYRKGLFEDRIILDQSFALDAIYTLFNRDKCWRELRELRGRFRRSQLENLAWSEYSREEQELFLGMMQSCGVCFVYRKGDKRVETEYIAPDLLPERVDVADELAEHWKGVSDDEPLIYEYEFLHEGLIRAIVSQIGELAGVNATYWRGGVSFYEKTTHARALIEQEMEEGWSGRIILRAKGGQACELLARLQALVENAQQRIGLTPSNSPARVERARFREESETKEPPLAIGEPVRDGHRRYVSYAWKDEANTKREKYVDELCAKDPSIRRDKNMLQYGDSIMNFMKAIGKGDRVYVFLSDKYLRSPFCMFELFEVFRNCRFDADEFLNHVRFYALPDAKIWADVDRDEIASFWEAERKKRESPLASQGRAGLRAVHQNSRHHEQCERDSGSLCRSCAAARFRRISATRFR